MNQQNWGLTVGHNICFPKFITESEKTNKNSIYVEIYATGNKIEQIFKYIQQIVSQLKTKNGEKGKIRSQRDSYMDFGI